VAKLSYQKPGLTLQSGAPAARAAQVADLQEHLRQLGYLRSGIDGKFGPGTDSAVRALRHDLLHNDGSSRGGDGRAPVSVLDFNRGRVGLVNGVLDQPLAACVADLLAADAFPKVPASASPREDNRRVREQISRLTGLPVPPPFLLAIFRQESALQHYREPAGADRDCYVVVGLDTNASQKHVITSRGYGIGQYTLFHHPPRAEEVAGVIQDPGRNVQRAAGELKAKFDGFVMGASSGTRADDRVAEQGTGPLRVCKYAPQDARYLRDCAACARDAGAHDISPGDRVYAGSGLAFEPTQYYRSARYRGVPVRRKFPCDWPYALRRYNGAGINSYHYQARVLANLLAPEPA